MRELGHRGIAALLFGSGLAALVYQTAWQRMLGLVYGASTAASAAVLAIFLGGLGLGGVADYTRLLAGALKAHGIESLIIGLSDREASAILRDATAEAPRLALPAALSWRERAAEAKAALDAFAPDWVSLQFVPFAYNSKGVVWRGRAENMNQYKARLASDTTARTLAEALVGEPLG